MVKYKGDSNKGWMFWGFIVLAILNVILLAYIFVGMNKQAPGLSPTNCRGGVVGPDGVCNLGDLVDGTIVGVGGSTISAGANFLNILINPSKQIKNQINIQAIDSSGKVGPTNVQVNGIINASTITAENLNFPDMKKCRLVEGLDIIKPYDRSVSCGTNEVIVEDGIKLCPTSTSIAVLTSLSYYGGNGTFYGTNISIPATLPLSKEYTCQDSNGARYIPSFVEAFCCKLSTDLSPYDKSTSNSKLIKKTATYNPTTKIWSFA